MNSLMKIGCCFVVIIVINANPIYSQDPNCGPNSLLIITRHFGIETTRYEINRLCGYDPIKGTTFTGLSYAAEKLGLFPVALHLTIKELSRLDVPAIVWVNKDHFIVVHKSTFWGTKFLIEDPPNAPETISKADLEKQWDGETLVFSQELREQLAQQITEKKNLKYFTPALFSENTVCFFGTVAQGDTLEHIFKIENIGSEPLVIDSRSTCSCIASILTDRTLAPGDTGEIKVTFETEHRIGQIIQGVTLRTNDPNNRMVDLQLAATVRGDNKVAPERIFLNEVYKNSQCKRTINVIDPGDGTLEIERIVTHSNITAQVSSAALDSVHGRFIPITLDIRIQDEVGDFINTIDIYAVNQNKKLSVDIYGTVLGDYRLEPSMVFWDMVSDSIDQEKEVLLKPYGSNDLSLKIGDNTLPVICELIEISSGGYKLICSIEKIATGTIQGNIPIVSTETSEVIAEIPIYAKLGSN